MERFIEPHTPALSRLSFHTADRRAPKFNVAPTNRAKSDREEAIQRDLEKREQENTPFDDMTLEFGIQKATLYNCFCRMKSHQTAYEDYQVRGPSIGVRVWDGLVDRNLKDFLPD